MRAGGPGILGMLLVGLSAASLRAAKPTSDLREVREASVGDLFTISLESNRTTGYGWDLAAPLEESIVRLVENRYESVPQPSASPPRAGAPGVEVWTFRGTGPGEATIALQYVRPWEKGMPPARTVTILLTVK